MTDHLMTPASSPRMTAWEPDPDGVLADGCRVRIEGGVEGVWRAYSDTGNHAGYIRKDDGPSLPVLHGLEQHLTVLREVQPIECDNHLWRKWGDGYRCIQPDCDTTATRLVPAPKPVDLDEALRVWQDAPWGEKDSLRAVLDHLGIPVKEVQR